MNKLLLIGGTGTLGEALIRKYISNYEIYVVSRDELKQWKFKQQFPAVNFRLGDMRNYDSMKRLITLIQPHTIILCAALKHIDICEFNIGECIETNITGVKNVIDVCNELSSLDLNYVQRLLFISTDKACHPINVYGMSKSISERLIAEASLYNKKTKFLCVRYGNVLNSRGSIIPKFKELAQNNEVKVLPVTSEEMTRFFMPLNDSIDLINNALERGESGDTWIPIIYSFKIIDLAKYFGEIYSKKIEIIGLRPGEKIHECLINEDEMHRTIKVDKFYVIKPCYNNTVSASGGINSVSASGGTGGLNSKGYTSADVSSKEDLIKLLENYI